MHLISENLEVSGRPNPPRPRFIDSTERPQQVVRLSPFRHVAWMRHRLAESPVQSLRLPALVIAFALAGGATGGLTAAWSQQMKRDNGTVALQGEVEAEASPNPISIVAVSSAPSPEKVVSDGRAVVHTRRRSWRTSKPQARVITVYNDFDFDLIPLKKRPGRKDHGYY